MNRRMTYETRYGRVIIESPTGTFSVGDSVVVHFILNGEFRDRYVFDKWLDGNTDNPRTMVIEECGLSIYPVIACKCQDDCNKIKFYHEQLDYVRGDTVIYIEDVGREYVTTFWECLENCTAHYYKPQEDIVHFRQMKTCCGLCDSITPLDYRTSYEQGEIVVANYQLYYCVRNYSANTCRSNAEVLSRDFFQHDDFLGNVVKDTRCKTFGGCEVCDEYLIYMSLEELIGCKTTKYEKWGKFSCKWAVGELEDILECNNNTDNNIEN